jgi:hypothetical protein
LIEKLLVATQDEELADVAFESLSSMVTHPETHKYPNHLMALLKRLLPLDKILYEYINEGIFIVHTYIFRKYIYRTIFVFAYYNIRSLIGFSLSNVIIINILLKVIL